MSALNNSLLLGQEGGGGYAISRSLRFNAPDSSFLSRTPASAGNRKTWTWAGWVKRSVLSSQQWLFACEVGGSSDYLRFLNDAIEFGSYTGSVPYSITTTAVYRDPSAWMHVVAVFDSTNATASSRSRLYVNGSLVTQFSSATYPSLNADTPCINTANSHVIGGRTGIYFSGLLADIHFCDGTAYDASAFGEFDANGIWQPKKFAGVYGTNGFHLEFADNSSNTATTLGKDSSGAGNTWSVNNLSVTAGAGNDSLVDVPTNGSEVDTGAGGEVRGNYCTLNPLQTGSSATLSNGNLDISTTSTSWQPSISSIFQSSGKWYAEFTVTTSTANSIHIGIVGPGFSVAAGNYIGVTATSYAYRADGGTKYNNASQASYGASYTTGDVIGVAMDLDAGTLVFYKNGTSQGTAYTGMTGEKAFAVSVGGTSGTHAVTANFGQRPFAYTAPSGFKALCTANLPAPVVTKPSTVMDVALYTGNGTARSITGLGFSPDMVWIKSRSAVGNHRITDIVRGVTKELSPDLTNAEGTDANGVTAFNSDGFSLGISSFQNGSGTTYAAWCWDAGSSTVTNTQGSISSQVRANASAGFSIVTYTGTGSNGTVGHGLGIAPSFYVVKARSVSGESWIVYHSGAGMKFGVLNATNAFDSNTSTIWNNTAASSTVFSLGNNTAVNGNGTTYVSYLFAPVAGYSSAFSITGNGSTDGPMCYLGFRPRFIIYKRTDTTANWRMLDTARDGYNVTSAELYPNLSNAEQSFGAIDILSNGFKLRNSDASYNASGGTYIGFAWAESPFQYARAR
jgi:hypothetical protein